MLCRRLIFGRTLPYLPAIFSWFFSQTVHETWRASRNKKQQKDRQQLFLGVRLDSVKQSLNVPPKKYAEIVSLSILGCLNDFVRGRSCKVLSIHFSLSPNAFPPVVCLFEEWSIFYAILAFRISLHWRDLQWWSTFLPLRNGTASFIPINWNFSSVLQLFTDASATQGCGGFMVSSFALHGQPGFWLPMSVSNSSRYFQFFSHVTSALINSEIYVSRSSAIIWAQFMHGRTWDPPVVQFYTYCDSWSLRLPLTTLLFALYMSLEKKECCRRLTLSWSTFTFPFSLTRCWESAWSSLWLVQSFAWYFFDSKMDLNAVSNKLIFNRIAQSSRTTYSFALKKFRQFCLSRCLSFNNDSILLFIAHSFCIGLAHPTAKVYISELFNFAKENNISVLLDHSSINASIKGYQRLSKVAADRRLPIKLSLMRIIEQFLRSSSLCDYLHHLY